MAKLKYFETTKTFRLAVKEQLNDTETLPTRPWFSLTNNKLDGTYYAMQEDPTEQELQVGWWSDQVSNSRGEFKDPPTVWAEIEKQALLLLRIYCDGSTNNYIVDAEVSFYDGDKLLRTDYIRGNQKPVIEHVVNLDNVDSFEVKVWRVSIPGDQVRVLEMDTFVEWEWVDELMEAPSRRIYAKVDVQFLDPFKEYTSSVSSEDNLAFTFTSQLLDGIKQPDRKWFSLTHNVLDGSFRVLPHPPKESLQVGWWSKQIADDRGVFQETPKIYVDLTPQPIFAISIVGDQKTNNYPVDFDIVLLDNIGGQIERKQIRNNRQVQFNTLLTHDEVARYEIIFYKGSIPGDSLRLVEVGSSFNVLYDAERLISVHLLEEKAYDGGELPVGAVSANELTVLIDNNDHLIDVTDPKSPYRSLLTKNRKARVYFGIELFRGYIKWYPYGTYYTTKWSVLEKNNTVQFRALDCLELLRCSEFLNTKVYENHSLYDLFQLVLDDFSLLPLEYEIDERLKEYRIPFAWFEEGSHRQALQYLAQAADVSVYVDRHSVIQVRLPDSVMDGRYTFKDSTLIMSREYVSALQAQFNSISVEVSRLARVSSQEVYKDEVSFILKPQQTLRKRIKYSESPVEQAEITVRGEGVEVLNTQCYTWGADLTLYNPTMEDVEVTEILVVGQPIKRQATMVVEAKDHASIDLDGEIRAKLYSCRLIQSEEHAQLLANNLLHSVRNRQMDVELTTRGNIRLGLSHSIGVQDPRSPRVVPYQMTRVVTDWMGAMSETIYAQKLQRREEI